MTTLRQPGLAARGLSCYGDRLLDSDRLAEVNVEILRHAHRSRPTGAGQSVPGIENDLMYGRVFVITEAWREFLGRRRHR